MKGKTLIDKIWDRHEVRKLDDGSSVLYIDRHYIHEVTSPQAFEGLDRRGLAVWRPDRMVATMDHNVSTSIDPEIRRSTQSNSQMLRLAENCSRSGIRLFGTGDPRNGIVHVIGPELGLTLPGMTVVCGDSHTATHGALGAVAFGIGTSEVEMVMATQCLIQRRPLTFRIRVDAALNSGVTPKDLILYILIKLGTRAGTGYFIEFSGEAIRNMSMEGRMTICNMAIEMGARSGLITPDEITYSYLQNRDFAPTKEAWENALEFWKSLASDPDAQFDREASFDASLVPPMITWGTNPGMAIPIDATIPDVNDTALRYMDFRAGENLLGKKVDYVFVGSCTNGRIEDLRAFAEMVRGHQKAPGVTAWIVPGSARVRKEAVEEGIGQILSDAGFELREPGCSACLAMNEDKVPPGSYCVSTSNRNFEGRQGHGARTLLAGPLVAAAAAVTGKVTDPRCFQNVKIQ